MYEQYEQPQFEAVDVRAKSKAILFCGLRTQM